MNCALNLKLEIVIGSLVTNPLTQNRSSTNFKEIKIYGIFEGAWSFFTCKEEIMVGAHYWSFTCFGRAIVACSRVRSGALYLYDLLGLRDVYSGYLCLLP